MKLNSKPGSENRVLRLSVEPGGCSGFQYRFELEDRAQLDEQDSVFEKDGAHVVVDEASLELLSGSTIDFEDEVRVRLFAISHLSLSLTACLPLHSRRR